MSTLIRKESQVFSSILPPFSFILFLTTIPILIMASVETIPSNNKTSMPLIFNAYPVALTLTRDANNNIISMSGLAVEMLQWLSIFDHFTFYDTKILTTTMENTSTAIGTIHYIDKGLAEMSLVPLRMSAERLRFLFFVHHWMEDDSVLVIPAPTTETNVSSVAQPFQSLVWILILVSIVAMICFLYVLTTPKVTSLFGRPVDDGLEDDRFGTICFFIFGCLFSQGGSLPSERLVVRVAALTWGFAAFVLVQAYCSILTSFLTTPTYVNLVNSPEELASKTDIGLVVRFGFAPDAIISRSEDPMYKILAQKLNSYSDSRCRVISDCMDKVLSGRTVFISPYGGVLDAIDADFKKTGRCRFSIAKKILFSSISTFGLAKNSSRKESFNRGILRMREKGLIKKWTEQFQPVPRRCLEEIANKPSGDPTKLTLAGLSGAFLILGVGSFASAIIFTCEVFYGRYSLKKLKKSKIMAPVK